MRFWILISGLLLLATSCRQDIDIFIPDGPGSTDNPDALTLSFGGQLLDTDGNILAGYPIRFEDVEVLTDEFGLFYLGDATTTTNTAFVEIDVPGFFLAGQLLDVNATDVELLDLALVPKVELSTFSTTEGIEIDLPGGGSLRIPPQALGLLNGTSYSGEAQLFWRYLNPLEAGFLQQVPAGLRGWSDADEWEVLEAFGVGMLEVVTTDGRRLDLLPDTEAIWDMPLPGVLVSDAPMATDVWQYNSQFSGWVQSGGAQRVGDMYQARLRHLSHCLVGTGFPSVQLAGQLNDQDGIPLPNATILAGFPNGIPMQKVRTSADGSFVVTGAADNTVALDGVNACGEVFWTLEVATDASNSNLGIIEVNAQQALPTTLSGSVENCSLQPVSQGILFIERNGVRTLFPLKSGQYNARIGDCGGSEIIVRAVQPTAGLATVPVSYSSSQEIEVMPLYICDGSERFVGLQVDGSANLLLGANHEPDGNGTVLEMPAGEFRLPVDGQGVGTFDLGSGAVSFPGFPASEISSANITCTFTQYDGELIEGFFQGSFLDINSNEHPVAGNFRIE
jgi:hypothetical protein